MKSKKYLWKLNRESTEIEISYLVRGVKDEVTLFFLLHLGRKAIFMLFIFYPCNNKAQAKNRC